MKNDANNNEAAGFSIDRKWMVSMIASFLWCILLTVYSLDYTAGGDLTFWGLNRTPPAKNTTAASLSHRPTTSTALLVAAPAPGPVPDYHNSHNSSGIVVTEEETEYQSSNNIDGDDDDDDDEDGISEEEQTASTELQILRSSKSSGQGVKRPQENNTEDFDYVYPTSSNNVSSRSRFSVAEILLLPPNDSNQSGAVIITEGDVKTLDNNGSNNNIGSTSTDEVRLPPPSTPNNQSSSSTIITEEDAKKDKVCNMFEGVWVHDDRRRPVNYYVEQCPFLSGQVSCRRNGRPDSDYENWTWEGKDGCRIPRFNGRDMLERLRGKRLIIVGDSLNRNQWESLACLLYSSIRNPSRRAYVDAKSNSYKVFKSKEHKCSVEFYWSPFLVQLDGDQDGKKVLKLDKVAESAKQWKGADIMVFNTGHWWVHRGKMQAWDSFQYKGRQADIEVELALEFALKTWSMWLHRNVDTSKTAVFFRSISPEHKGKFQCDNKTELIKDESYRFDFPRRTLDVVEKRMRKLGTKVKYLNITKLSSYRQDGHPSTYARKDGIKPQDRLPTYSDCSHWCLPGLPDTWNRLLYAHMVLNNTTSSGDISH